MRDPRRWAALLAALWLGMLLAVAGLATPAPFATLARADAGRVVAHVLQREAWVSLAFGVALVVLARATTRQQLAAGQPAPQFGAPLMLALGALFCTLVGYFAVQPMMEQARAGAGAWTFGQLHAASGGFYAVKIVLVAVLAWRCTAPSGVNPSPSSSR
jgi:Domain of unknown function (DUF4149)